MKTFFFILILLILAGQTHAQKIGLVLSGGGAKGIAHVGVIKALEENEIPIDYIVGTSMGGIVGGCYAAGMSPDEIRVLLVAAVRVTAKEDGGSYLVEVGASAQPIETMLNHLRLLLGIGLPLVVLVAAAGGSMLVKRALTPVERIAGKAESISQHNLSERLPVARTGDELERLLAARGMM